MTVSLELDREAKRRGLKSVFVPTGQTGSRSRVGDLGRRGRLRLHGRCRRAAGGRGRLPRRELLWVEGQVRSCTRRTRV
jgi:hypothetical protein